MKKLLVAVAALGLMVSGAQASIIFDHFSDGAFDQVLATGTASGTQGPGLSQVIGGQRDFTLTITQPSLFEQAEVQVVFGGGLHFMSYANDPGIGSVLDLKYGEGADLNTDLSGCAGIGFLVTDLDQNVAVDVTLTSGVTSETHGFTVVGPAVSTLQVLPMSVFTTVNLNDIDKMKFSFTGPTGLDFQLDALECTEVPEPATLLLLGLGALPLVRRLRRS
jgi:hypothetical protein